MATENKNLRIIIIGGSLSGLMCGISLKHAGHSVRIIEQSRDERQSHMAGVCLGPSGGYFLSLHDRLSDTFYHRTTCLQVLKGNGEIKFFYGGRRDITSWETYYFRLRSLFDGYISDYSPKPPTTLSSDGSALYSTRTKAIDLKRTGDHMTLSLLNLDTQQLSLAEADFVIGADGPDSFVRSKYLPHVKRRYMGYVAWRGIVPENEISDSTRQVLSRGAVIHRMDRHHCIMYLIPGANGSLEPGERYFNFLWYTNESLEDLDEIMVDAFDNSRHHNIVPAGCIRPSVWSDRLERAKSAPFPAPFLEVITKIRRPFIQVITEFHSPRAVFEDGLVLLAGDALALFCPHTALSGTQAAFHTLAISDYIAGRLTAPVLESKMVNYSRLYWSQSIWWGKFYQCNIVAALPSGIYYWAYRGVSLIRKWWHNFVSPNGVSTHANDEYIV